MLSCKKEQTNSSSISTAQRPTSESGNIGINVVLKTSITTAILDQLRTYGNVGKVFNEIKAVTMLIPTQNLNAIKKLTYVSFAGPDAERKGAPIDAVSVADFSGGISTWDNDAINVTDFGAGRTIAQDGTGVYVGVLDSGLPDSWRSYFPQERIATQYAKAFNGGGGDNGNVSEPTNKWEHDQNSHGGHVTSTIIGYQLGTTYINGVAPKATVIPVKVLNQTGSGWSSVIAEGILYMASLKAGALSNSPVVINMSLGGSQLDGIEKAAIDYAISKGIIIVASAGNNGAAGMGYPGAYQPVISVAAAGWKSEFKVPTWWYSLDVPEQTKTDEYYIADFSAVRKTGQDLDVTAPGANIVGPYQVNSGQLAYYYLSGTSMSSPHVAGIVALMAQKKPSLTAAQAETKLESAAVSMAEGADLSGSGFITATAALKGL
ncbi:MAG: S8 family serine peptidase [Bacteroidota bacterium]